MKVLILFAAMLIPCFMFAESVNVYFGTGAKHAKGIYRATFDTERGKLSEPVLAAEISNPGFLAMNAERSYLYAVAKQKEPVVAAYRIEKGGELTLLNTVPIGDGGGAHISVHPSGTFLMTAQYGGGSVAVFSIAADGSLAGRSQLIDHNGGSKVVGRRQDSPHPHWTGFSPDGKFGFVPDLGMDQIVIYTVDAQAGSIKPHGHAQAIPGGGPRHMRFSVDGQFIYLLNELSLSVTTFAYDASAGACERLSTTPALSEAVKAGEGFNSASEIVVHPSGRFAYSANRGNDSVTAYATDAKSGTLTVLEVEPIRGSWPRNINLDPSGKWLLAAGAHSDTISIFGVDQENGLLKFQTRGIRTVPGCICILFGNPKGR